MNGRPEIARILVDAGASMPTLDRDDSFIAACVAADHAAVGRLIELGADPSIYDEAHDSTPLGWAMHCGNDDVAAYLQAL
ncbi:MAG: hypothetical protein ACR2HR_04880 [Euzebya sp.]